MKNYELLLFQMLLSKSVVITTGTFLGGQIFRGMKKYPAGRIGEKVRVVFHI